MKKILTWLVALIALIFILSLAAFIFLPRLLDFDTVKPKIEQQVSEATGRPFSLGDDFTISTFPWLGFSFSNLRLGNPNTFGSGNLATVESFEARLKLLPLLSRKIELKKFVIIAPDIHLIREKDGKTNWDFASTTPTASSSDTQQETTPQKSSEGQEFSLQSLDVGEFSISKGRLTIEDRAAGKTTVIEDFAFHIDDVSLTEPLKLSLSAVIDGKPVSLAGTVGPIGQKPGTGTINWDLALKLAEEMTVQLQGEVKDAISAPAFSIHLTAPAFSPQKAMEALSVPLPITPSDPTVLQKAQFDVHLRGTPEALEITDSSLMLDDTTLAITAGVELLTSPKITFSAKADSLNLDRYLPEQATKQTLPQDTAPAESGRTASQSPAVQADSSQDSPDFTSLRKLLLRGDITIGELVIHGATLEQIALTISGKDGLFSANPLALQLYQGNIAAKASFDISEDTPQAKAEIQAENIQVGPLLQDSIQKDILEGATHLAAKLSFSGLSADEIKKNLNGSGTFRFSDGALVGIDIAQLGRNLTAKLSGQESQETERTEFSELKVPFTLTDGLFTTKDSSLISPLLRVKIFGSANLVSEELDMKIRPKVVGTLKGQGDTEERSGLTVPILVSGTFQNPRYSADLSGIANKETLQQVISDPESAKQKAKDLEEQGKSFLKGLGF